MQANLPFVLHRALGVIRLLMSEDCAPCDSLRTNCTGTMRSASLLVAQFCSCSAQSGTWSSRVRVPPWVGPALNSCWPDENTMTDCLCGAWIKGRLSAFSSCLKRGSNYNKEQHQMVDEVKQTVHYQLLQHGNTKWHTKNQCKVSHRLLRLQW